MDDDIMHHYSRALDEIFALRALMAAEARVTEAHLGLKSFPKSRRQFAEEAVERQRRAARGEAQAVYTEWGVTHQRGKRELRAIGASETLTREGWERG